MATPVGRIRTIQAIPEIVISKPSSEVVIHSNRYGDAEDCGAFEEPKNARQEALSQWLKYLYI